MDGQEQKLDPTQFASSVTAISSAFGDPTRRDIFLLVHASADGLTAAEVADHFGIHTNVARHHLDKLAAGAYVEVGTNRAGAPRAGRPSKRYTSTAAPSGPELPVRHDTVLVNLLGRALSLLPRAEAEAMAEEVGIDYGRALASSMGDVAESQRSFRSALHMVADAMTARGFAATVESSDDALRIVSSHCPFGGAEVVHPVICAVDRGMVQGMMSSLFGATDTTLEPATLTDTDVCTATVS